VTTARLQPRLREPLGEIRRGFVADWISKPGFWVAFLTLGFVLPLARALTRPAPVAPPAMGRVPAFSLVDHSGRTIGTAELVGRVWVAGFISMTESKKSDDMTKSMSRVRYRLRNLGHAFQLVTITLDPARDLEPVRLAYAQRFHANPATWSFLGGSLDQVEPLLASFQLTTAQNPSLAEFSRRERMVLIDQNSRVRGSYASDIASIDALVADAGLLANDPPIPTP